jgi:putative hemolysin
MIEIVVILGCLLTNALLSCFEMAFVTLHKPQLRQMAKDKSSPAAKLLKLRENPERTLSIIQIGITFVGMISAAVGGAGAEESFAPILQQKYGMSDNSSEAFAIAIVVIPLTMLNVVIGELVPKSLALKNPVQISFFGARWILIADRILAPLVTLLEKTTRLILKIFPKKLEATSILSPNVEMDLLSHPTQQYILNLVSTETRKIQDVMVPWAQVAKVNDNDNLATLTAQVVSLGHTRLPIINDANEIKGMLHTKEFIALLTVGAENWHGIIRPTLTLKGSEFALAGLRLMQSRRTNLAVVTESDGKPIGIVTLEDIIEEIVGDLFDEDDDGRIKKLLALRPRVRT